MGTTTIGDASRFAIEYELQQTWPPFGRVRLWAGGAWFGDIERSMFLYHLGNSLAALGNQTGHRAKYARARDVPRDEELLTESNWSWGDVFDDFFFTLYAIEGESAVHLLWALIPSRSDLFPGYPLERHRVAVPLSVFQEVVSEFVKILAIEGT